LKLSELLKITEEKNLDSAIKAWMREQICKIEIRDYAHGEYLINRTDALKALEI